MSTITPSSVTARNTELRAATAAGADMVAAATRFAERFAVGAMAHDRDGTFANEHLAALRDEGFLAAPVPRMMGGGGVTSVHDVLVASSRLAEERGPVGAAVRALHAPASGGPRDAMGQRRPTRR